MSIEQKVLIVILASTIISMFFVPKDKYRLAILSFLTFHALTWSSSILLVQFGVIRFPVREFPKATQVGFIETYMFFPMVFVWATITLPSKAGFLAKILHQFAFISFISWSIFFIDKYTDLEGAEYSLSALIQPYICFPIYFILSHLYIIWFRKNSSLPGGFNHES